MRQQFVVRAALDDPPVAHHHDLVGALHRGNAVRHQNRRPLLHHFAQPAQDALFGVGVHARKRIVQDQNSWLAQDGARQRCPLLLAAGKRDAALADHGVEPLRKALNLAGNAGDLRRFENVLFVRVRHAKRDVLAQRLAEKERVLRHVSDRPPQLRQRIFADGSPIDEERSRRRFPQARDQRGDAWICRCPVGPTIASVEPAGTCRLMSCSTGDIAGAIPGGRVGEMSNAGIRFRRESATRALAELAGGLAQSWAAAPFPLAIALLRPRAPTSASQMFGSAVRM